MRPARQLLEQGACLLLAGVWVALVSAADLLWPPPCGVGGCRRKVRRTEADRTWYRTPFCAEHAREAREKGWA